jgi:hypothetical protein
MTALSQDDVMVGPGNLAGRGVYAARDFAPGEVVVSYRLTPLDEAQYRALPAGEDLFVHSFAGRRYLYPAPARYVNHADDPSCVQDFDRCCDIARRPIAAGDPVTIDCHQETARELGTFLEAYRQARDERSLGALLDAGAVLRRAGETFRGRDAVAGALLAGTRPSLSEVEWLIGTGRWEALCAAADGPRHVTILLKVVAGNWQLVYQHDG